MTNVAAIVAAIFIIEGGERAKVPYGILSVKVKSREEARRVCENTVRNNIVRWQRAGATNCFYDFLADRYCPKASDPRGNLNWKKNIKNKLQHRKCDCHESKNNSSNPQ